MDIWEGLKSVVAKGAPVLANAIVPGSGGMAASLIGKALGVDSSDPEEMTLALKSASPEQWAAIRQAEIDNKTELAQIAAELDKARIKADSERIESVNKTMRAEAAIEHPWSGMWRPFWGFISAAAFGLVVIGIIVWGIVAARQGNFTAVVKALPDIIFALSALFGVPMTILGVASHHRGKEKRARAGEQQKPGLLSGIGEALTRKGSDR